MNFTDEFKRELQARNAVTDVISSYINLKRRGKNLVGLCPFHGEKTPSFTVYPNSESYYCFGCSAGGDIITFTMQIENLDYVEAVKLLASRSGIPIPEDAVDDTLQKLKKQILEANREAAGFFHDCLSHPSGSAGISYFRQRNLSDEIIRKFMLGYAPAGWDSLINHLKSKGFSEYVLFKAGLISKSSKTNGFYDFFRNRAMFPIFDLQGNITAFGGRVLDDSKPKYINTSDTPVFDKSKTIYSLNNAKNVTGGRLVLAEGYMDVITMYQAGAQNAVACLGTAFTEGHASILRRYADEIVLVNDTDEPGQIAQKKIISILSQTDLRIRVVNLPAGKDVDEFINKRSAEEFLYLLNKAGNHIEYLLSKEKNLHDDSTADGKTLYLKEAAKIISSVYEPVEREVYISKVCEEENISREAMTEQVKKYAASAKKREVSEKQKLAVREARTSDRINPDKRSNMKASNAEEKIIKILMQNPEMIKSSGLMAEDFVTGFNKRVFAKIKEVLDAGGTPLLVSFSQDFQQEEMSALARLMATDDTVYYSQQELSEAIEFLNEEKQNSKKVNSESLNLDDFFGMVKGKKK